MSTETKSVTVELSVESAYEQLVGFQTAAKSFREAQDNDDKDGQIAAANAAVESCIALINEVVPDDLSDELHARLGEEHPDLADPGPSVEDLVAAMKRIFGEDFDPFADDSDD